MPQIDSDLTDRVLVATPGPGSRFAIRKAICLLVIGVCIFGSGCRDVATIWSAESRSPDGNWLAVARTEHQGGAVTSSLLTIVYLKWLHGSQPPVKILEFSYVSLYPAGGTNVAMTWITPSHLEVAYKEQPTIDFQAVKCTGIDISLRDLSRESINPSN
jgi:hypothetical protein